MDVDAVLDALSDIDSPTCSDTEWSGSEESGEGSREDHEPEDRAGDEQSDDDDDDVDDGTDETNMRQSRWPKGKGKEKDQSQYSWVEAHAVNSPPYNHIQSYSGSVFSTITRLP